jgi:hypothetical protein
MEFNREGAARGASGGGEDPATHQKRKIYRGMTSTPSVAQPPYDDEGADYFEASETPAMVSRSRLPYEGNAVDVLHGVRGHLQPAASHAGDTPS